MPTESKKQPSILKLPDGQHIAYHKFSSPAKKNQPGIIFMGGFKSDMEGAKAIFLENYCQKMKIDFLRFDYFGHGKSSGDFLKGTISRWRDDALAVLDNLTSGPQILIGSSLGGWIMLLAALARKDKIKSLIGIAAAPDFTERLIWDKLKESEKETLRNTGFFDLPSEYCNDPAEECEPYTITYKLIDDARKHLLLNKKVIDLHCNVNLIHGMKDLDVPYGFSIELCNKIAGKNVTLHLAKDGNHRMSEPESLEILRNVVEKTILM